jgi:carbon monoxide dehydrogenase subunit G
MELTNEFRVDRPIDETWNVLTDVERIAPALPGAQLQEIEGDEYRGIVKVKVGPITAQYKGKATFVEKDDTNHKAVLRAEGRDTKGQGNASALITATLVPDAQGTKVTVHTDLSVTGKVAQFGRGIMADVSTKLLNQFVEQLETTILAGNAGEAADAAKPEAAEATKPDAPVAMATAEPEAPASPPNTEATPTIRRLDHPEPDPVDLVGSAGASVAKRVVPVVIGGLLILLFARGVRRRHRG